MRTLSVRTCFLFLIWAVHLCFFTLLVIQPSFAPFKKPKPLIVNTITPKPSRVYAEKRPAQQVAAASAPAKKSAVAAAAVSPKKVVKKEAAIANKVVKKAAVVAPPERPRAAISEELLQRLEESIAKIDQKSDKRKERSSALSLHIDTGDSDAGYVGCLVEYLHQQLTLPEHGEVKIRLSLRQDGSVVTLTVLHAQSQENKKYLERALPSLRFPRFTGEYVQKKECEFVLTFLNENKS